jgi:hypothetical protein
MCRAWNGVSYQELERLLPLLSVEPQPQYWAIVGQFIYPWVVPSAGTVKLANLVGELHVHQNRKGATLIARMSREPLFPVEQRNVDRAVEWLDVHWRGSRT